MCYALALNCLSNPFSIVSHSLCLMYLCLRSDPVSSLQSVQDAIKTAITSAQMLKSRSDMVSNMDAIICSNATEFILF